MDGPISEKEGEAAKAELRGLLDMVQSAGWKLYFHPLLESLAADRLEGCVSLGLSPGLRAEHVQGYHDMRRLLGLPSERIKALEVLVAAYNRQEDYHRQPGA